MVAGQDGVPRSSFRPRADAPPAALVIPAQANSTGPAVPPGSTPGNLPPRAGTPDTTPKLTPPATGQPKGPNTVPGAKDSLPLVPPGTGPAPVPPGTVAPVPDVGVPPAGTPRATQDPYEAYIRLEPPGRERLFGNRDTEAELVERMRQERRDAGASGDSIQFPEKPKLTEQAYQPRRFAPMVELVEPGFVVYRRLYFEERNAERYGWELGPLQPIISSLYFFKDVALLPHNCASYPCRRFETNAGYCRPGDPVPYIVYPPEFTGSGLLAEVGIIALMFAATP